MKVKVSLKDNSSWIPNNIVYDDVDLLFIPTKELIKMYLQKQSNWNSLREWLKEYSQDLEFRCYMDMVLDKMNELEGKDNN